LVAADAGRAVLRRIAAKSANVVLLNIFIYLLVELRGLNPLVQRWPTQDENAKNSQLFPSLNQVDALGRRQLSASSQPQDWNWAFIGGALGGGHEALAVHVGNLRRYRQHWETCGSAKLSVVLAVQ
jgi:hypothetical protein